jgi:hypothetical protein
MSDERKKGLEVNADWGALRGNPPRSRGGDSKGGRRNAPLRKLACSSRQQADGGGQGDFGRLNNCPNSICSSRTCKLASRVVGGADGSKFPLFCKASREVPLDDARGSCGATPDGGTGMVRTCERLNNVCSEGWLGRFAGERKKPRVSRYGCLTVRFVGRLSYGVTSVSCSFLS